jgi:hypothetical protein
MTSSDPLTIIRAVLAEHIPGDDPVHVARRDTAARAVLAALNACPRCDGIGWLPDKPWKGPHRNWMRCYECQNAADHPEPDHLPTEEDYERERRR